MNERLSKLYKEATGSEWAYDFDKQIAETFANLIIKDIVITIAAQALMGESAVDVFTNITRIYTDQPLVEDTQPVTPEDYDF